MVDNFRRLLNATFNFVETNTKHNFITAFFLSFVCVNFFYCIRFGIESIDPSYGSFLRFIDEKKTRKFQYIIVGPLDRTQLPYLISIILLLKFPIKSHFFQLRFFFACICTHMNHIYFAVIKKNTNTLLIGRHH